MNDLNSSEIKRNENFKKKCDIVEPFVMLHITIFCEIIVMNICVLIIR